jgi:hypothetical protein
LHKSQNSSAITDIRVPKGQCQDSSVQHNYATSQEAQINKILRNPPLAIMLSNEIEPIFHKIPHESFILFGHFGSNMVWRMHYSASIQNITV